MLSQPVTLWPSQIGRWHLVINPLDVYLQHDPCSTSLLLVKGPHMTLMIGLGQVVSLVVRHRCPPKPPVTPQLVDDPGSESGIGSASLSGPSPSSPSPRPT